MITINKIISSYILIVFLTFCIGNGIISIYGDTCGFHLFRPSTWVSSWIILGSPWCKYLGFMGQLTNEIASTLWYHLFFVIGAYFTSKIKDIGFVNSK